MPQNWLNIAVDAITSFDQTGKKVCYQSGAHWYPNPNRNRNRNPLRTYVLRVYRTELNCTEP